MSITTKQGDEGFSRLFSGEKVLKNSPRLDAYGDIDELVSLLGIARNYVKNKEAKKDILYIQKSLFVAASELATTAKKLSRLPQRLDERMLSVLDEKRSCLEAKTKIPKGFIVPASTLSAAYLDYARAVSRRCERKIVTLLKNKTIQNKVLLIWFNRLSDYLYLLARREEPKSLLVKDNE
ncbi:MAG: cob(I)yrinic acid a,c-diamide adenosyltransferase [Candidatus Omnitrophota bacterium]